MKHFSTRLITFTIASFFSMACYAQTMTETLAGAGNFIVPCSVSSITVSCWGGGGAGQGDNTNNTIGGGGGGSGAFCSSVIAVTPGQSIAYSVGAGGAGNSTSTFSVTQNGGASTFGGLTAGGGAGGNGPTGGAGGTASGGTTNTNGAAGANRVGGAGGAGGAAPGGGGAGGAAGADAAAGSGGAAPGGAGGGAGDANVVIVTISKASGSGGAGRITVSYDFITAGNDQNLAACLTSGTLNATAVPAGSIGTWTCVTNCGGVSIATPTSPTSAFSGLTVPGSTTFRWTVTDDPGVAGGAGCTSTSDDVVINTLTGALCPTYCSQDADMNCSSFSEAITSVVYRTISNSGTGCSEPGSSTVVTPGQTNAITISTVGSGTYDLSIHIDWNADGDFADAGEFILVGNGVNPGTFNSSIAVPAGATCDAAVRMRIIWNYSANTTQATACATNLTYGEIEDYTLNISCCTPNCSNGIQDCTEQGVDCGGPCGTPCAGVPSCTNSIQDQDEVGVDCGGLICAPCGTPCSTFSGATASPAAVSSGGIVDATVSDQTISTCVNVTYSNRGTNWLHGVFINTASTGFVSSQGVGAVPEPNYSSIGTTYRWRNLSNNFTGNTSGNSMTQDGWYVVTGAADNNPGDNLGWPDGAGTTFGPFCFETVVSCDGLDGDVNAFINFQTTGDSYSGSWTTIDCGRETSFGANSFSYTLRCPSVLPVEMLNFNADFTGRIVKINWATLSEHNSSYFEVYKSNDGTFFEKIETVKAAGNSSFRKDYTSYDLNPSNRITYYKIRQYDVDGNKSETKILALITPLQVQDIAVIPNPVNTVSSVTFTAGKKEMDQVFIRDLSGKIVWHESIEVNEGANEYTFNTTGFNPGIYFLELANESDNKKIKFIKSQE
ncbi:MAG: Protein of unknown function precursor [Crocinitomicaceae bacterium]|jgi:hypothetical protein|nr:Protein of unknown function precursor [Crocinitomicaceae bacterium]